MTPKKTIDRPPPDYEEITRRIIKSVNPERVILFGSRARGDNRPDSDIDIIVVFKKIQNRGERIVEIRNAIGDAGYGIDVLVYSAQEMINRADWSTSPISYALKEGKSLYERPRRRGEKTIASRQTRHQSL
jgi:predicted nucleotidyltransferase